MAAFGAVARVAYLAADVVIDSLPALPAASPFAVTYDGLVQSSIRKPNMLKVPFGGDPAGTIIRNAVAGLVSFTTSSDIHVLTKILLHLAEISTVAVVLHIALTDDLSDAMLLKSAVPFFLVSFSPQEAHDHALLASKLARLNRRAVVHAFYVDSSSQSKFEEVSEDRLLQFLLSEQRQPVLGSVNVPGLGAPSEHDSVPIALYRSYTSTMSEVSSFLRRSLPPLVIYGANEPHTVIITVGSVKVLPSVDGVAFMSISLLSPTLSSSLLEAMPSSANHVIILEHVHRWSSKLLPYYLEVAGALQQRENQPIIQSGVLYDTSDISAVDVTDLIEKASVSTFPTARFSLGTLCSRSFESEFPKVPHVPKHELAYIRVLEHVFKERLEIINSPDLVSTRGELATLPEYALGRVRGQLELRQELVDTVHEMLRQKSDDNLHSLLSKWLLGKDDAMKSKLLGTQIVDVLERCDRGNLHQTACRMLSLKAHFPAVSRWIIGSDAWSYDLGASGLHHAIASGLNINVLILDTLPYTHRASGDPHRRKHDIGLYAMNHGDAYVASVAIYSSYSQVLQAVLEADRFCGPSIVLAYLPYISDSSPALDILKETKLAVDNGYWPLYRWDPSKERDDKEPFSLDSEAIKNDLRQFLDRQNHLSQLTRSEPQFATELVNSLGESLKIARREKAKQAYDNLLTSLNVPPLLILYASDGGAAEKMAKRHASRGKARGLSTTLATMDSMTLEDLAKEEQHVSFILSTAGQGEPPQNGRTFFKALNSALPRGIKIFHKLRYSVFGMGDSKYWPRPEDAHYYNRPGRDLDIRLERLGGQRIAALGLGDDQDADGPKTGYQVWEPLLWKALGVDAVEVTEAEPESITNEHIKAASSYLRGTITEGLEDTSTSALAASDTQLTKFHGIYQQDDRDIRDDRQAQGIEPAYSFMIRVRMPGGVCKPVQWLQMEQIADEHGSGTFKITTRQTFQFHGVIKRHLKPAIQDINRALLDTLAACGDVNRNVVCSSIPTLSRIHKSIFEFSKDLSDHLLPRTTAYHEIWLDKKLVAGEAIKDFEPLYGEFYLPRKFKIAVAVPPTNDVDVYTNDVGFIAIVEKNELIGFNVTVGGGMGVTHGNKKTYPRTGDVIGFCTVEQGKFVAEKIMLTQRDNGNRVDRKNARLKYTIDRMGIDVFKNEVESRLGYKLEAARLFSFDRNTDDFGWATGEDGNHHFTLFIENGRVQDQPGYEFKTGLREIAKVHKGTFRLTTNQHLIVSDVTDADLLEIKRLLAKYKLDNLSYTALRLSSSACVAFPTCGLAMAESERYLPILIGKVEKICEENGLRNDAIVMRMTGCPNGCARPYVAEIAFVGKAPGTYSMLLGGGYHGQRLNKIYRETVTEPEILDILKPMIRRYASERLQGERFGDFTIRAGYISATSCGKEWYVGMGGEDR